MQCSFVICFDTREYATSSFVFFKVVFTIWGSLRIHMTIFFFVFAKKKKSLRDFDKGCIESVDHFGYMDILTTLIFPMHEHGCLPMFCVSAVLMQLLEPWGYCSLSLTLWPLPLHCLQQACVPHGAFRLGLWNSPLEDQLRGSVFLHSKDHGHP